VRTPLPTLPLPFFRLPVLFDDGVIKVRDRDEHSEIRASREQFLENVNVVCGCQRGRLFGESWFRRAKAREVKIAGKIA
jgi:hypothetical protein